MKTGKKLLSLLLVAAMCFSLMAVTAFADSGTGAMAARGAGIDDGSAVAIEEILGLEETPAEPEQPAATEQPEIEAPPAEEPAVEPTEPSAEPTAEPTTEPSAEPTEEPGTEEGETDEDAVTIEAPGEGEEVGEPATQSEVAPEDAAAVILKKNGEDKIYMSSLTAAISGAESGDVVRVLAAVPTFGSQLVIGKSIDLDLNGYTLRFETTAKMGSAIAVTGGAMVTIKNGTVVVGGGYDRYGQRYGFNTAIASSSSKRLALRDLRVVHSYPLGTILAASGAGGIKVYEGVYSADPSAFLADNHEVSVTMDGEYVVTEKQVVDNGEGEETNTESQEGGGTIQKDPEPDDVAMLAGNYYKTLKAALAATGVNGGRVTLLQNASESLSGSDFASNGEIDLSGCTLTGSLEIPASSSYVIKAGEIVGDITVKGQLTLDNVRVKGNITLEGGGYLCITGANSTAGTITVNASAANTEIVISAGTYDKIVFSGSDSNVIGNVSGGTYGAKVPDEVITLGYTCAEHGTGVWTIERTGKVTILFDGVDYDCYGKSNSNAIDYYKTETTNNRNVNMIFTVTPAVIGASVITANDTTVALGAGDYTYASKTLTIPKGAAFLKTLPAGENFLLLQLEGGAYGMVKIHVWPSVTYVPSKHMIGSGEDVIFTLSDYPAYLTVSTSKNDTEGEAVPSSATAFGGGKMTLSGAYLDTLQPGTYYFDLWYLMGSKRFSMRSAIVVYKEYVVTEINNVDVIGNKPTPVTWRHNSGTALSVTTNGNASKITGVKVDGVLINPGNYTISSDSATVNLSSGYLNTLANGNHSLTVVFTDGEASTVFTVKNASLSPKTGDANNLMVWAAVLILSGAAVLALVPRKKKQ